MKARSAVLPLAALATLSLSALAPTQASAWGMRDGYGSGYRSMGFLAPSIRHRVWASEPCDPCPSERAPVIQRPPVTVQGYGQGYGRGYGSAPQMQGYAPQPESHGRPDMSQINRRDSYEDNVETPRRANPASAQTELQR